MRIYKSMHHHSAWNQYGLMIIIVLPCAMSLMCSQQCTCDGSVMQCSGINPEQIPDNVTLISLFNLLKTSQLPPAFKSIRNVSILLDEHINGTETNMLRYFYLRKNTFANCEHTRYLKVSSKRLTAIESGAFNGLDNLHTLDLSDNVELSIEKLVTGLQGDYLPNLRHLYLKRLGVSSSQLHYFSRDFFNALINKPIETLDLSQTIDSIMDPVGFSKSLPNLRRVNFSEGGYIALNFLFALAYLNRNSEQLKEININYARIPKEIFNFGTISSNYFLPNITELHVRALMPYKERFKIRAVIKQWQMCLDVYFVTMRSKLEGVCFYLNEKYQLPFLIVDLSDNHIEIEYVDPIIFSSLSQLRYYNVSSNKLSVMKLSDFELFLCNCEALIEFHCSENALKIIPRKFFANTTLIRIINLSHSQLETISFDIDHLLFLDILDISNNNIIYLDTKITTLLDNFIITKPSKIKAILFGNPLQCSCDAASKEFIKWLTYTEIVCKKDVHTCDLNGRNIIVDETAITETEYLCNIPLIITLACTITGTVIIVLSIALIIGARRWKRRKTDQIIQETIEMHRIDENKPKFVVFLSYSSSDSEFVLEHVFPEMDKRLKELLHTNETCVATGDFNFQPGFYVADQITECVQSFSVVVLCVSHHFCNSRWCKDEIMVTKYEKKPMLLMFLEEVEVKTMPKVLHRHFQSTTRSKWTVNEDGEYRLIPDWNAVCRAIIHLMRKEGPD